MLRRITCRQKSGVEQSPMTFQAIVLSRTSSLISAGRVAPHQIGTEEGRFPRRVFFVFAVQAKAHCQISPTLGNDT